MKAQAKTLPLTDRCSYPEFKPLIAGAFFAYVVAHILQFGIRFGFLGSIRFEFLLASLLIVVALIQKKIPGAPKTGLGGPLIFFFLCVLIAVPISVSVAHSWEIFVERVVKFAFIALFIARFVNNPKMLLVFLAALLLSYFKMGQEGLLGNITGGLVWQNQGVMRLHGSTPNYAHPNSFAGVGVSMLPFIYYLFPLYGYRIKAFLALLLVFAVNIIVFCGSRTAYVASFAFFGFVFYQSEHKFKAVVAFVILGLVAVPFVPDQYVGRFQSIFTGQEAEGRSSETRLEIIRDAIEIFVQNPLGVGVGAFPIARERFNGLKQDTHNLYLEVATNLGIQGFVAFCVLIVALLKSLAESRRKFEFQLKGLQSLQFDRGGDADLALLEHRKNLTLYVAVCNLVTAYIVLRLVLGLFGMDLYEIYWWVGIGLAFALVQLAYLANKITNAFLLEGGQSNKKPGSRNRAKKFSRFVGRSSE